MSHALFPSRYYRHCRDTLDFDKLLRLPGALEVIHRSIEGHVHRVVEIADRPRYMTRSEISRK